jgi:hypothetical protein
LNEEKKKMGGNMKMLNEVSFELSTSGYAQSHLDEIVMPRRLSTPITAASVKFLAATLIISEPML